ncbi:helix-turn-helix transcriptional regulator [Noviherbaspirillum denitrificans]|uniref:ParB/Sulfiredoxin domain-containing protein n=1 Tax=Noviherbaspirillum denitrificans TaxID=1968433 RepID=A0A254T8G4_9BURK|nr:chromosome partitioning protein ParB [Noviherbaspirillum denitrificans]OWW18437.1 hypothetical protein AYR66_01150 [Noviherbaspirillum denitrificans]OWW19401.1 hypothetical protein AYR66_07635 [Noviherbaspirillum denitrificans]
MPAFSPISGAPTRGCPTDLLEFDRQNPRLLNGNDYSTSNDEDIISALNEISPLDEVITSICTNTYLDFEPLIVMGPNGGPYRVLEGNRRLASIKLIKDPDLAAKCRISLPRIRADVRRSVEKVTVWRVDKESDAQAFIGFKHINGPSRWDAYAKARFVSDWYKRERENGLTIDQIARQLGDDNDTIRAYISSIFVLEQAEGRKLFDIKNRYNKGKFAFSHLYTALGRTEYQDFLGLDKGWSKEPVTSPVPRANEGKLKEVLLYLYGDKRDDAQPLVKSQNPDLKHVGEVIAHPVALERIRTGEKLSVAYNEVRSPYDVFSEVLAQAHVRLSSVIDALPKYNGEPNLLAIAREISQQADILLTVMKKKSAEVNPPATPKSKGAPGTKKPLQKK